MNNETNDDKQMALVFYNMYLDCLKYKKIKENKGLDKKIDCNIFYDKFKLFCNKCEDTK